MPRHTTITLSDRTLEGTDMEFQSLKEAWNEYKLEDGSLVRVRVVVSNIVVTIETNEVGDPLVVVKSKTLVSYHPAEGGDGNA